jgi:hypothetical protein
MVWMCRMCQMCRGHYHLTRCILQEYSFGQATAYVSNTPLLIGTYEDMLVELITNK